MRRKPDLPAPQWEVVGSLPTKLRACAKQIAALTADSGPAVLKPAHDLAVRLMEVAARRLEQEEDPEEEDGDEDQ